MFISQPNEVHLHSHKMLLVSAELANTSKDIATELVVLYFY